MKQESLVARQPIIDRHGSVVAYELLFRNGQSDRADIYDGVACSTAVVERALGAFGLDVTLGELDGYINCPYDFLFSECLSLLPAPRFVLEILEDVELNAELGEVCEGLRAAGFRIALDDVRSINSQVKGFLKYVDIVKLDWPYLNASDVQTIVTQCKQASVLVLAEKVEERSDHAAAMASDVNLFQGYYFAKPQTLAAKRTVASYAGVCEVLRLLMNEASDDAVEKALKNAPTLLLQVLRLANSGGSCRSRASQITSVKQALALVGHRQLVRWCTLLLYGDSLNSAEAVDPLLNLVERRSTIMESMASGFRKNDPEFSQSAWLAGLLSLAHVPNGVCAEEFIGELPISLSIRQAITTRQGELGRLLSLAEHVEAGRWDAVAKMGGELGMSF